MSKMKLFSMLFCSIGLLACGRNEDISVEGVWLGKFGENTKLILGGGNSFSVFDIPASFVCDTDSVKLTSGHGKWEYVREDGKIILKFDEYSNKDGCVAPFGANAFLRDVHPYFEIIFGVVGEDDAVLRLIRSD